MYVRFILESFLFTILSCLSEIFRMDDALSHPISYNFAFLFSIGMIAIIVIVVLFYRNSKDVSKSKLFSEFYAGFKSDKWSKMYHVIFMTRRVLIILVILTMRSVVAIIKLPIFTLIQIVTLTYSIKVRPYEEAYENIVEVVNDTMYVMV